MFDWKAEWKKVLAMVALFLAFFWLPAGEARFTAGIQESLNLGRWYAREHVILCLVPALFIAGAIGIFVSQAAVMRYLGARANKVLAYGVASVAGTILAVCSCTVLPLFAGIWKMGAGLGPASAFLYSGPAINVLAIVLTARILGMELGIARAVGAIGFSVIIGLFMHLLYRKEEHAKALRQAEMPAPPVARPLWQNAAFFASMVGILVFANWGSPNDWRFRLLDGREFEAAIVSSPEDPASQDAVYAVKVLDAGPQSGAELSVKASDIVSLTPVEGPWTSMWKSKWLITGIVSGAFGLILWLWIGLAWWKVAGAAVPPVILALALPSGGLWVLVPFSAGAIGLSVIMGTSDGEAGEWFAATWTFAKQILPLLFFGVLAAGFLLGRPGHEGLIPGKYIQMLVGDRPDTFLEISGLAGSSLESAIRPLWPLWTNIFASVFGAFMYFATLTEVPIVQGLIGAGMGKGPALALLLAGPALSLPSMLVMSGIMGVRKTVAFCGCVVVLSSIGGMVYGAMF